MRSYKYSVVVYGHSMLFLKVYFAPVLLCTVCVTPDSCGEVYHKQGLRIENLGYLPLED